MRKLFMVLICVILIAGCITEKGSGQTSPINPPKYYLTVYFIDVGHGDCTFIETPDDSQANGKYEGLKILIDAGDKGCGKKYVIPYLKSLGMKAGDTLDYVIATHCHADHIGGLPEIYDTFQVNNTIDPGYTYSSTLFNNYYTRANSEPNTHFYFNPVATGLISQNGDYINLGTELKVRILYSNPSAAEGINNTSIVLWLQYQDISFLFMGDGEGKKREDPPTVIKEVEKYLVDNYGDQIKSTVLKVGHHGSETASTNSFMATVQPKYAVICAGNKAFSGTILPDQSVLQRYIDAQITLLRTDQDDQDKSPAETGGDDNVVIKTDGKEISILK